MVDPWRVKGNCFVPVYMFSSTTWLLSLALLKTDSHFKDIFVKRSQTMTIKWSALVGWCSYPNLTHTSSSLSLSVSPQDVSTGSSSAAAGTPVTSSVLSRALQQALEASRVTPLQVKHSHARIHIHSLHDNTYLLRPVYISAEVSVIVPLTFTSAWIESHLDYNKTWHTILGWLVCKTRKAPHKHTQLYFEVYFNWNKRKQSTWSQTLNSDSNRKLFTAAQNRIL